MQFTTQFLSGIFLVALIVMVVIEIVLFVRTQMKFWAKYVNHYSVARWIKYPLRLALGIVLAIVGINGTGDVSLVGLVVASYMAITGANEVMMGLTGERWRKIMLEEARLKRSS